MNSNTIEFRTTNNELHNTWVMKITADRRIEVNENVEVTEAAKKVLEAMQSMLVQQKRAWVDLTDKEIKKIIGSDKYSDLLETVVHIVQNKLKEKNT